VQQLETELKVKEKCDFPTENERSSGELREKVNMRDILLILLALIVSLF